MRKNNTSNNFIKLLYDKKWFLMKVYSSLIFQLIITFAIVYYFRNNPKLSNMTNQSFWFYLIVSIGLLLILMFLRNLPTWIRYIILSLLSIVFGALLHFYTKTVPKELIDQILLSVIGIFVGMTILAFILANMGIDLSWMAVYLLFALLGLIIAGIVLALIRYTGSVDKQTSNNMRKIYLTIGIILFTIMVVFDTNIMLQKEYREDFITASIDLYLDFINIFSKLLGLEEID
jgi:hypothetical protein